MKTHFRQLVPLCEVRLRTLCPTTDATPHYTSRQSTVRPVVHTVRIIVDDIYVLIFLHVPPSSHLPLLPPMPPNAVALKWYRYEATASDGAAATAISLSRR